MNAGRLSASGLEKIRRMARERMEAGANAEPQGEMTHYEKEMQGLIGEYAAARYFGVKVDRWVYKGRQGPTADLVLPDGSTLGVKATECFYSSKGGPFLIVPKQDRRTDYYLLVSVDTKDGRYQIQGYTTGEKLYADYEPEPYKRDAQLSRNMPKGKLWPAGELRDTTLGPAPEPVPEPEPEPEWTPPPGAEWRDPEPEDVEELEPYDPRERRVEDPKSETERRRIEHRVELTRALYPLIDDKGNGPYNSVRVRGRMATVKNAFSCKDGVAVVFARERETVYKDKKNTPIMRYVDVEEVEVIE